MAKGWKKQFCKRGHDTFLPKGRNKFGRCSIKYFKRYIEKKFYGGMTWNNYGKYWQLDHVVSLWKFDLTNRKQFLKAVNYKNIQPLTIPDHKKKTALEVKYWVNNK
jgi:hypothetical protein